MENLTLTPFGAKAIQKTGKKVVFSLRVDEAVLDSLKEIAKAERRSVNSQLELFVENKLVEYLKNRGATK